MGDDAAVGWIAAIIIGGIAGWLAEQFMKSNMGLITNIVLGIVGAFLATFIGQAIGHYGADQGAGFITATIGALIVLFIWNRLVASGVLKDFNR